MFDKFLESQAKQFIGNSRTKFEEFLDANDVDKNGEKDKKQLLDDFDEFAKGLRECAMSGSSMVHLIAAYYNKFGPKVEVSGSEPHSGPVD
ncbi:hypothetical protein BH10CYA1_BH10CYA1_40300 [soil metagenome]